MEPRIWVRKEEEDGEGSVDLCGRSPSTLMDWRDPKKDW